MNVVMLIGRLTRDPEQRMTQSGSQLASFTIAVDRHDKDRTADFISCTAWNKTADTVIRYLKKGSKVGVQGAIRQNTYDGRNGEKQTRYDVLVDRVEFLGSKKEAEEKPTHIADMEPVDMFTEDVPLPF